jgi:hypothetical protein
MATFLLERITPAALDVRNPDALALHSRWALDEYQAAGITWLGAVATDSGRMFGLVVGDNADQVDGYCRSLGIPPDEYLLSEVIASIGPHMAMARTDPRFRPYRKPVRSSSTG